MRISCNTLVSRGSPLLPSHSSIDSALEEGVLNIILEYVPGGSVASLVQAYGAFEESLAANWVLQVLRGLEFLHEHTIVHQNIKSSNVLVDNMGVIKISEPILTATKSKGTSS